MEEPAKRSMTGIYWSVFLVLAIVAVAALVFFTRQSQDNVTTLTPRTGEVAYRNMTEEATLMTSMGDITIQFYHDQAPNTVENFVKLAESGYYDGIKFHRVIDGFMIQGGDPLSKDDSMMARWGTGGPGYTFEDEIYEGNSNDVGTISMANAGPNTNGSQFFINVANNDFLNGKHTVFGKVTQGMDVLMAISQVETEGPDRPVVPVVINSVSLN